MINYSLIFTNNREEGSAEINKYLCFDNKIHIRLRDFNKEEVLTGFEKKFTYLLSYLINYLYIPKLVGKYSDKEILESFLLDETVEQIIDFIRSCIYDSGIQYSGLLLKLNYKKDKNKYKAFGDTDAKFFPLQVKNNVTEAGSFEFFLTTFNLDLYNYLFNDDYAIWLHEKDLKPNKKFETRKLKKINKLINKNINIVELW